LEKIHTLKQLKEIRIKVVESGQKRRIETPGVKCLNVYLSESDLEIIFSTSPPLKLLGSNEERHVLFS